MTKSVGPVLMREPWLQIVNADKGGGGEIFVKTQPKLAAWATGISMLMALGLLLQTFCSTLSV